MNVRLALCSLCAFLVACGQGAVVSPPGPLWTETSSSIDLTCSAFFQGSMRFAATRDQLSASQLDMLSRMTVVDGDPICIADGMGCSLTIVDAAQTTMIDAIEDDSVCTNRRKVVSYETFNPFRTSLGCQYAKQAEIVPQAVPVTADARCYNGLFTNGSDGAITVTLGVDDASSPHRIELDDCAQPGRAGNLSFTVLDSDGATILGSSAAPVDPGPDGTCAALDLTFPHSGGFALEVAVASGTTPGDLYLRFF